MLYIVDDEIDIQNALQWIAKTRNLKCGVFSSGESFLSSLRISPEIDGEASEAELAKIKFDPKGDCVLLDIRMNGMSGIEVFNILNRKNLTHRLPVIFITGHGEVSIAVEAIKRGACDFFEKPFNDDVLFKQVDLSLSKSEKEFELAKIRSRFCKLTTREKEILGLILGGKMNKVISDKLGISMRTVEVHRSNILDKMQVKSAIELAAVIR